MLMTHIELSASLFADFLHKKRSERTTGSGADRKKVKRNGYVKRWTRGGTERGACEPDRTEKPRKDQQHGPHDPDIRGGSQNFAHGDRNAGGAGDPGGVRCIT